MLSEAYAQRRGEIQTYFDRTAVEAWKRFATEAPLGRIRATVREGRATMRAAILSCLPDNLAGWKVLDAGCGTGAMSVELARRGAMVTAVDVAPEIIRFAGDTLPKDIDPAQIRYLVGDMLAPSLGNFDAVVAMDSLIHYRTADAVNALASVAGRTGQAIVFTFAPWSAPLAVMHAAGRLLPAGNRAPSIVPVRPTDIAFRLDARLRPSGWQGGRTMRVSRGFYKSQAMELVRQ